MSIGEIASIIGLVATLFFGIWSIAKGKIQRSEGRTWEEIRDSLDETE